MVHGTHGLYRNLYLYIGTHSLYINIYLYIGTHGLYINISRERKKKNGWQIQHVIYIFIPCINTNEKWKNVDEGIKRKEWKEMSD